MSSLSQFQLIEITFEIMFNTEGVISNCTAGKILGRTNLIDRELNQWKKSDLT